MFDINSLFSGMVGTVAGAFLAYWLQSRLIKSQIAAAEKTQTEFLSFLREAKNYFAERSKQYSSALTNMEHWLKMLAGGDERK